MKTINLNQYLGANEPLYLVWDEYKGNYILASKIDDKTLWLSNNKVMLKRKLAGVLLESLTNNRIHTVGVIQTREGSLHVFANRRGQLLEEVEFKVNELERFKIFKHMDIIIEN